VCVDAAKRRQLPAWIREGLEKMEREKQRQMERDRQLQDAMNAKKLQEEEERDAVHEMHEDSSADRGPTTAVKSRFVRTTFHILLGITTLLFWLICNLAS